MKFWVLKRKTAIAAIGVVLMVLVAGVIFYTYALKDRSVAAGGPEPIFQGNTGSKMVAITVNVDWGEEFLPAMLTEFKKNNAQVTFFVTGRWAEKNADMLQQMAQAGHSVQNHGYRHVHFNALGTEEIGSEIKKAEEIIFNITGQKSSFFASPYGEYNPRLVQAVNGIGYQYIMWSVDTIDWQKPAPETIVNRVMKKVHNDAIILMHPTEPTVKALPTLLGQLQAQGYQMVSIDKITAGKSDGQNDAN
ncbi:MAG: polysaccharide deacetylase family protein [Syntrophomonadaceae bacterium]